MVNSINTNYIDRVWRPDLLTRLYVYSMCLLVYATAEVSWLMRIPRPLLYAIVSVIAIIKITQKGICTSRGRRTWILVWFTYIFITIVFATKGFLPILYNLVFFFSMSVVALLSYNEMRYLLKAITNCFVFILVISIFGWFLFLAGVPLSYTGPHYHENGFHVYYDYFFFTASSYTHEYQRFSSVFLEPGQMATPCVFLFHLNTRNDKIMRFRNLVLLTGIIMSYSLIAYGLLLLSIVANQLTRSNSRYKVPIIVVTFSLLGGLYWYFTTNEDTAIYVRIISRLEYDEENNTISGYNRTGENFEFHYAQLMRSSDKWFGIRNDLNESNNWTIQASGYKKFIVNHGIVGLSIVLLFMVILFLNNTSVASFIFFTIVVVAFLVRDLLTTPLWLTIAIIGMYILGEEKQEDNYSNEYQLQTA